MLHNIIIIYLFSINIIAFITFGIDKWKATHDRWRISEKTLFGLTFIGGSVGAILGMRIYRHKTKHRTFTIGIPVILFLQVLGYWFISRIVL